MQSNRTTRLMPPAIPTKVIIATLVFSLICITVPTIVGAAPKARTVAPVESTIAHVDVSRPAPNGKALTTTRLSVRLTSSGQPAERSTSIQGVHYEVKLREFFEAKNA